MVFYRFDSDDSFMIIWPCWNNGQIPLAIIIIIREITVCTPTFLKHYIAENVICLPSLCFTINPFIEQFTQPIKSHELINIINKLWPVCRKSFLIEGASYFSNISVFAIQRNCVFLRLQWVIDYIRRITFNFRKRIYINIIEKRSNPFLHIIDIRHLAS